MRKITLFIAAIVTTLSVGLTFVAPSPAYAADEKKDPAKDKVICEPGNTNPDCKPATQADLLKLIQNIIKFLAAGVGVVVTTMFAYSGFRYLTAGNNPSQVADAKSHISNALIALLLYIFGMALLNFIVPGGITGLF